jgi:hypothetical protein
MIDFSVFAEEIAILMDWFNRDFEEVTLKRLHQRLSEHLSTAQFKEAALTVFDKSRFFPTVEDFVTAVKGSSDIQALAEWELCLKAAARADRAMISKLTPQGQSALHLIGGLHRLGLVEESRMEWVKKEFVAAWKATPAERKALPQSRNPDLLPLDAVQALSIDKSMNRNSNGNGDGNGNTDYYKSL